MHSYCSNNAVTVLNAAKSLKIRSTMNFKNLKFTRISSASQPASQPAVRPGSAQGRIQNFAKGGSWLMAMVYIVRSTMSMQSMLMLGGSGGMPHQENLKN